MVFVFGSETLVHRENPFIDHRVGVDIVRDKASIEHAGDVHIPIDESRQHDIVLRLDPFLGSIFSIEIRAFAHLQNTIGLDRNGAIADDPALTVHRDDGRSVNENVYGTHRPLS